VIARDRKLLFRAAGRPREKQGGEANLPVREREGGERGEGRGAAHFAGAVAPLRGEYGPDSDRRCILSPPPPSPSVAGRRDRDARR
jgi:hypothetical protein